MLIRRQTWRFILISLTLSSCGQRKCQAPVEQPFQTFTETQWRLVETNDPNPEFRKLSLTNFLIMTFKLNSTGDIKRVENNDLYETPVATFIYDVDKQNRRIRAEISQSNVTLSTDNSGGKTPSDNEQKSTVDYQYSLGREFTLTGTYTGFRYRFVPFTGVVAPDKICQF